MKINLKMLREMQNQLESLEPRTISFGIGLLILENQKLQEAIKKAFNLATKHFGIEVNGRIDLTNCEGNEILVTLYEALEKIEAEVEEAEVK